MIDPKVTEEIERIWSNRRIEDDRKFQALTENVAETRRLVGQVHEMIAGNTDPRQGLLFKVAMIELDHKNHCKAEETTNAGRLVKEAETRKVLWGIFLALIGVILERAASYFFIGHH